MLDRFRIPMNFFSIANDFLLCESLWKILIEKEETGYLRLTLVQAGN